MRRITWQCETASEFGDGEQLQSMQHLSHLFSSSLRLYPSDARTHHIRV